MKGVNSPQISAIRPNKGRRLRSCDTRDRRRMEARVGLALLFAEGGDSAESEAEVEDVGVVVASGEGIFGGGVSGRFWTRRRFVSTAYTPLL
jgi:hypothetical protein